MRKKWLLTHNVKRWNANGSLEMDTAEYFFDSLSEALKQAGDWEELDQVEIDHGERVVYVTFFNLGDD